MEDIENIIMSIQWVNFHVWNILLQRIEDIDSNDIFCSSQILLKKKKKSSVIYQNKFPTFPSLDLN